MYYRYFTGWTSPQGGPVDAAEFSLLDNELVYVFPSDGETACVALSVSLSEYNEAAVNTPQLYHSRLAEHRGVWPRIRRRKHSGRSSSHRHRTV